MKQADTLLHISADPTGFTLLETAHTQSHVWFLGDGIVRIRTSFENSFREESLSLLRTAWEDLYDDLLSSKRQRVSPLIPQILETEGAVCLVCDGLVLTVQREPFALSVGRENGPFSFREVSGRAYTYASGRINHSFRLDESSYYGFGEKTGPLEKTGTRMIMSNKDACGYDPKNTDPLYKHLPFFIKLSKDGQEACGIYYNTSADCTLDIGKEYNGYWPRMGQYEANSAEVDLFYIAGPTMAEVVRRFSLLTGRPALLPKFAYGYLGSTMFYSELPEHCDEEILSFVEKTRKEGIPCSNFQLSSGYTTDPAGKRNVFSWNLKKFPVPDGFIGKMEDLGATVTPNIKPALLTTNPLYNTFRQAGAFIYTPSGEPYVTQFWGGKGSFVDFTNPAARSLWQKFLKSSLLDTGIHSVWNDNNEFDIMDDEALCFNEGHPTPAKLLRARLPMLMNITSGEALEQNFPCKRLYQVTRSGSAGICRYAQTWTGDNLTCWDSLRYNIATMLGASLSGMSLTGSDIGGFAGPAPEPELLLRWIWCGVLLPRFSIHSANSDNTVTEPWMYPEHMDIVRKAFRLRNQLLPYLYSLNAQAHHTGDPMLRPMVYEFPKDAAVRYEDVDFMLGNALLAACVVEEGATVRCIYLPQGEVFYDLHTRKRYQGGQTITVPTPLDSTPLFQRGGSILPLRSDNGIDLWICPDRDYTFTLYEDDGISNDYRKGVYLASTYSLTRENSLVTIRTEQEGSYAPGDTLIFHVQCTGKAPCTVLWNGHPLPQLLDETRFLAADTGWHYHHSTKTCTVKHGTGRNLTTLTVSFEQFDLIRMDDN